MYDADRIISAIKVAALDAVNSTYPVQICYGNVVSVSPLKVKLSQQLTLSEKQLHLTSAVVDRTWQADITGATCPDGNVTARNVDVLQKQALAAGDIVILLRMQGGQKYIILDRVVK